IEQLRVGLTGDSGSVVAFLRASKSSHDTEPGKTPHSLFHRPCSVTSGLLVYSALGGIRPWPSRNSLPAWWKREPLTSTRWPTRVLSRATNFGSSLIQIQMTCCHSWRPECFIRTL